MPDVKFKLIIFGLALLNFVLMFMFEVSLTRCVFISFEF